MGGLEPGNADDRRYDKVRFRMGGADDCPLAAVDDLRPGDSSLAEALAEIGGKLLSCHGDDLRTPANGLSESLVDVAAGGDGRYLVAIRKLLNDGQGALADGAGGTEDSEAFQRSAKSKKYNLDFALESSSYHLSVPQHWSGQQQRVDAVKDATMAGKKRP